MFFFVKSLIISRCAVVTIFCSAWTCMYAKGSLLVIEFIIILYSLWSKAPNSFNFTFLCQTTYGISHLSLAHIIHFLFNMLCSGSAAIIVFYKHVNRFNQLFLRDYTPLNISKLLADFSRCFWLRKCSLHHLLSYRKTLVDNAASCI